MPTASNRTKKALQEISKVFRLASRLTADISRAVREIENLQREAQRLKNAAAGNKKPTKTPHGKSPSGSSRTTKTHTIPGHTARSQPHRETKPDRDASEFVFPRDFNPPTPPEPSTPSGNN